MIGRALVELLMKAGAKVRITSLDDPSLVPEGAEFLRLDLTRLDNCLMACEGIDIVFHLASIKGSPKAMMEKPASFFVNIVLLNTNIMEAARLSRVEWLLYTSTVGVYQPAEVFHEDDVWLGPPSAHDKFAGWAKRMGELQAEAYTIQYGKNTISIVRPANVYGLYDNFDSEAAMVIPSLIKRAVNGEDPFVVWGDGTAIRDFIYAEDVARGMMFVVEKKYTKPVNLGSGKGYSIKEIVDIVLNNVDKKPKVVWDVSKPTGDRKRLMDVRRAQSIGFEPHTSLNEGIKTVMDWYRENKSAVQKRYNKLTEG